MSDCTFPFINKYWGVFLKWETVGPRAASYLTAQDLQSGMSIFGIHFCYTIKICCQGKRHLKLVFKSVCVLFTTSENVLISKESCPNVKQVVWQVNEGKAKNDIAMPKKM